MLFKNSESYLNWEDYILLVKNRELWNFRNLTAKSSIKNYWQKRKLKWI